MEGIFQEVCFFVGYWGLGKFIVFYDDNYIFIDGDIEIVFIEDVDKRFEVFGWYVIWVKNGNIGYDEIRVVIKEVKVVKDKFILIKVNIVVFIIFRLFFYYEKYG